MESDYKKKKKEETVKLNMTYEQAMKKALNTPLPKNFLGIEDDILGSWKRKGIDDVVISFENDNVLTIESKNRNTIQYKYWMNYDNDLKRWKITAPDIGLHVAFISQINDNEMIIDNSLEAGSKILIEANGLFDVKSVSKEIFVRVK